MENHDYPFEFFTQASINIADDDELIHLMIQAGFNQVFIGIETPNEASLKECSKNQNCQRDMIAAIKKLQASGDNTDSSLNFIPRMDRTELIEGYRNIVKTIYSPGAYYQRVCKFLKYYNPFMGRKINAARIGALLKSIVYLGILGNGITQWCYWELFIKSFLFYRKSFTEAMTLMIYGHHFRKVEKNMTEPSCEYFSYVTC